MLKPTSRGKVSLRGLLPDAKPRILHNYLTTEEDRASMLAGVRIAMEIAKQAPLKAIERGPCEVPASDSDEDLMAFVRRTRADRLPPDVDVRDRRRSSTTSCASTASRACASSTPR